MAQQVRIDPSPCFVTLRIPLRQQLFVFRSAFTSLGFFFFDLRHLCFQLEFGRLDALLPGFSIDHQLENLVLVRSEEHTSELQSQSNLVCRLLLEKKKKLPLFESSSEFRQCSIPI